MRHNLIEQGDDFVAHTGTIGNQGCNFRSGCAALLRQLAHFARDHGKATTVLACACRFNFGVERQQVGALRNFINNANALRDFLHFRNGVFHHHAALAHAVGGSSGNLLGGACIVGILADGDAHFFQSRRGFFRAGGLFFGTDTHAHRAIVNTG